MHDVSCDSQVIAVLFNFQHILQKLNCQECGLWHSVIMPFWKFHTELRLLAFRK